MDRPNDILLSIRVLDTWCCCWCFDSCNFYDDIYRENNVDSLDNILRFCTHAAIIIY